MEGELQGRLMRGQQLVTPAPQVIPYTAPDDIVQNDIGMLYLVTLLFPACSREHRKSRDCFRLKQATEMFN